MSGKTAPQREQCWVINNEIVDPPPAAMPSKEELTSRHHAYIDDLDAKGLLVGAGPFLDDTGNRFGTGMIIIRAATRREAETIANQEPLYRARGARLNWCPGNASPDNGRTLPPSITQGNSP